MNQPPKTSPRPSFSRKEGYSFYHTWLCLELLLLFGLLPFVLFLRWIPPVYALVGGLTLAVVYLLRSPEFSWREAYRSRHRGAGLREWKRLLGLWAMVAVVGSALCAWLIPERFLAFPRERPELFAAVMLLYPLLSVLPQEVLFRGFFHTRYRKLLGSGWPLILAGGIAFGWAHIIFNVPEEPLRNPVAVPLTVAGGILFSYTYEQTRSLVPVWAEHALYGSWVWTCGLGWYFYYSGQQSGTFGG